MIKDKHQVSINDTIVLIPLLKGQKISLRIEDRAQKIPKLGVYNPAKLLGKEYGSTITLGSNKYWLIPANTFDKIETITRKAQIILPKDAATIGLYCDITPGSKVVEGGLGSGALTIVLLTLVGQKGKVISYETRSDFAKIGRDNITKAGLASQWELKNQDIMKGITEENMDAVVLDIPEPWGVIDSAYDALRPGGSIACYVPTMNQVEKTVNIIRKSSFIDIHTFETLQREIVVGSRGVRPAFEMLGHTGYTTIARKVLAKEK